jgi:hypothetical protein
MRDPVAQLFIYYLITTAQPIQHGASTISLADLCIFAVKRRRPCIGPLSRIYAVAQNIIGCLEILFKVFFGHIFRAFAFSRNEKNVT